MHITRRDIVRMGTLGTAFVIFHVVGWKFFGERILLFGLELLLFGNLGLMLILFRKIEHLFRDEHQFNRTMHYRTHGQQQQYYEQIEALFSLLSPLKMQAPLPKTGGMAASPDFLKKIAEQIYQQQPELVFEASSGISTLIAAYCLKNIGKGQLISLEHDAKYAALTQQLLATHGLDNVATVRHAPLTEIQINGKTWLWYDIRNLALDKPIDILVVDGPPDKIQTLARYPVLPLLFDRLNTDSTILLDDGNRPDEKHMVEIWLQEFQGLQAEFLPFEKGAFFIHRHPAS